MAKKLKFVTAKLMIGEYTGDIQADIANVVEVGLLKEGIKIETDTKTIDTNVYGMNGKVHLKTYVETAKVSSKLVEVNAESIKNATGLFTKTDNKYVLSSPSTEKVVVIEEKEENSNGEKLRYVFYPCVFSGKLEINYDDKETEIPLEFTVYADETSENGDVGMYYETIA